MILIKQFFKCAAHFTICIPDILGLFTVDSITLTGPTQLSSGHQGTWTCTYTGGTPTLQMTINNNPVYGSVNKALGFDQTVLSLQWTPTLTNNNQYLCCSAIGVTNPPPQCLRLQIQGIFHFIGTLISLLLFLLSHNFFYRQFHCFSIAGNAKRFVSQASSVILKISAFSNDKVT